MNTQKVEEWGLDLGVEEPLYHKQYAIRKIQSEILLCLRFLSVDKRNEVS